jgi:tRNA A-37 threonylcarbamoyl transferase component Bud32
MYGPAPPGRLIGSGRAADVYDIGSGRVLRRYRALMDTGPEARLMTYLRRAGFPVPEVFDADGADLVLARLTGPDMLADLGRRPWLVAAHARVLAGLHDRLHALQAPDWLARLPEAAGDRVLHLDLHPANVMLSGDGPMVIDWSGAAAGPPGADTAIASLIMRTSDLDDMPAAVRLAAAVLRSAFIRRFEARVGADSAPHLAAAARRRLRDPNVRPAEAARLRQIIASAPAEAPRPAGPASPGIG